MPESEDFRIAITRLYELGIPKGVIADRIGMHIGSLSRLIRVVDAETARQHRNVFNPPHDWRARVAVLAREAADEKTADAEMLRELAATLAPDANP